MVNLLESTYYIICVSFGMTFVISTGGIDLSVGNSSHVRSSWLAASHITYGITHVVFFDHYRFTGMLFGDF